ncbi:MAG: DM13 domain-containing protein [Bacteroidetes bacterium]|nr:DM13 domain-containing protein [Bacteroidota bacterium]MBI3482971.1 DM13 domain-containing protein [Bacteroidota bacterium]
MPKNITPAVPPASGSSIFDSTKAQLLKTGMFVGLDGPTSGTASVYDQAGTKYIVLNPFQSHSGPDLYVYLSKDKDAVDYIRVGKLQAISGKQIYAVPGKPVVSDYGYVHIWCQQYSVDFARAEIK